MVTIGGLQEGDAIQLLRLEADRLRSRSATRIVRVFKLLRESSSEFRWVTLGDGERFQREVVGMGRGVVRACLRRRYLRLYFQALLINNLDSETRDIFRSMSVLPTWARTATIRAMNPTTAAIEERIGRLVSLSLVEDNRKLVLDDRRYQQPFFAQYLALKRLTVTATDDNGKSVVEFALKYYLDDAARFARDNSMFLHEYLTTEFINIKTVIEFASTFRDVQLMKQCVQLASS